VVCQRMVAGLRERVFKKTFTHSVTAHPDDGPTRPKHVGATN
jgi:hypothetical protein